MTPQETWETLIDIRDTINAIMDLRMKKRDLSGDLSLSPDRQDLLLNVAETLRNIEARERSK